MHIRLVGLIVLLMITSICSAKTTISAGKLQAVVSPEKGVTQLKLNGKIVMTGSSTHAQGALFTLLRNTPTRDWEWPANRDTPHYAPSIGKLVDKIGQWKKHTIHVLKSQADRYVIEHRYQAGVNITYDHHLVGPDLKLKITIDNKTADNFQLHDWLLFFFKTQTPAKLSHQMGSYYPAGDVYSPVTMISDRNWGVGINYIEHDFRPLEIRLDAMRAANTWQLKTWLKNSPIAAGSQRSYTMIMRVDDTPGDWKHLLLPYKKWFNDYLGPVRYSMDFRVKAGVFCGSLEGMSPTNPRGFYGQLDRQGWQPFINQRVGHLRKYNTGEILIWGATGISKRGVNYRPEFDVFPKILEDGLPQLKTYFQQLGNKRYGFFARPNTIAYQRSNAQDADVSFNPLDARHVRMADRRYENLLKAGATAFYMDTYGADWGCFPDSAKASVFYLKHLREKVGPDVLLVTEFGFDAFHVFAPIWPNRKDKLGHLPYGQYARWLVKGSVDFCRVDSVAGARRVWEKGAVPMLNDFAINNELMQLQKQFVNSDGSSKARNDCLVPVRLPTQNPRGLPSQKVAPLESIDRVDSLFKR